MDIEKTSTRRTFLGGTILVGGLAMLLGLQRPLQTEPDAPKKQEEKRGRGYRLTEHVKRYYESARL